MDNKKKIEIPFGAFDSELIRQEINIPNGFNAVIEGDKIILTRVESEDERTRKAIHIYLDWLDGRRDYQPKGDYTIKDMIAWLEKQGEQIDIANKEYWRGYREGKQEVLDKYTELEKQGEQKPDDKAEQKFHEGEWVVTDKNNIVQIKAIENGKYLLENTMRFSVDYVDICWRKWTIQDAKPGDVLHSIGFHSDCIFIFDGPDNWKFDEPDGERAVATGYCCLTLSADNMEFGIQGLDCIEVNTVKPATKIQRDLLFQKIKEAGYEWSDKDRKLIRI